jgi:hypothetical protein
MATVDAELLADVQFSRTMMFGFCALMCFLPLVLMHLLLMSDEDLLLVRALVDVTTTFWLIPCQGSLVAHWAIELTCHLLVQPPNRHFAQPCQQITPHHAVQHAHSLEPATHDYKPTPLRPAPAHHAHLAGQRGHHSPQTLP